MFKYGRIIFLDEENTALSPLAEALLKYRLKDNKTPPEVSSAGNVVLFPEPANQKIAQIAKNRGVDISGHSASGLSADIFGEETLVLAMDGDSKTKAYSKYASAANVYTLKEYVGENGDIKLKLGGTIEEYDAVCDMLARVLESLAAKIEEKGEE